MTTQTLTLTEFLLARIAEDEAIATETPRRLPYGGTPLLSVEQYRAERARVVHAMRFGARRMLAECEAKRRIVEHLEQRRHYVSEDCWYTCAAATEGREGETCCDDARCGGACDCGLDTERRSICGLLALPYADHPDYRDEWQP